MHSLTYAGLDFERILMACAGDVLRMRSIARMAFFCCEGFANYRTMVTVDDRRETVSLIGSDKVEGTAVYGKDDRKIGSVQRVMIDKISGKIAYAVVSFGGFLGMGEEYFPMPWATLKYDTGLEGYRVNMTEDQLKGAPRFNRNTDWDWSDRSRDRTINDYYRTRQW
jgi:hypothetical protein